MGQYNGKFGGIKYNDDQVNSAKERIKNAEQMLDGTQSALATGFRSLASARGIEYIDCLSNEKVICNFPNDCVEYIEDLYNSIENKAREIEEYRDSPWYKKVFATVCMGLTKFGEGIVTVGEQIVDAGASLVGFTAGIFGNKEFQDSCGEFIKKDHVGEFFADHINGEDTWIGKWSSMSPNSTGAKLFKGVGTAAGYIALATVTGGGSVAANVAVAATAGLGAGTQQGLQEGKDFNSAFGQGIKQAAVQGATAYVAGKIGERIQSNAVAKAQIDKADDLAGTFAKGGEEAYQKAISEVSKGTKTIYNNNVITNSADDLANVAGKAGTKIGGKIADSSAGKAISNAAGKISNNGAVQAVKNYAGNVASDAAQLGKTVVSPATKVVSNVAGKAGNIAKSIGQNTIVKGAINTANKAVGLVAANPTIGNVTSAALYTAPVLASTGKAADNLVEKRNFEVKMAADDTAMNIFDENIDYSFTENSNPDNKVTNIEDAQESSGTESIDNTPAPSNNGVSGGGSQAPSHQGAVSYRTTGGGTASSYTPIADATPTKVADVATPTNPTDSLKNNNTNNNQTSTDNSNTTNPSKPGSSNTTPNNNSNNNSNNNNNPTNNNPNKGNSSSVTDIINNKPSTPNQSTTSISSSGTSHSGGGYSNSGYSFNGSSTSSDPSDPVIAPIDNPGEDSSSTSAGTLASSITDTSSFKNQTIKIPSSTDAIEQSSQGNNIVIPTAAAISAAAAAGIGAKAYMDHKENSNNEEEFSEGEENEGFYSEEWNGTEDDIKVDYGTDEEQSLDAEDDYSYSADSIIEKYEATNNSELQEV